MKYFNDNVYIVNAITSKNFCSSGKEVIELIIRNALRFGAVVGVGNLLFIFIKLSMVLLAVIFEYVLLSTVKKWSNINS